LTDAMQDLDDIAEHLQDETLSHAARARYYGPEDQIAARYCRGMWPAPDPYGGGSGRRPPVTKHARAE
jgi:hypothetical protein